MYEKNQQIKKSKIYMLTIALVIMILFDISTGVSKLSFGEIIHIIFNKNSVDLLDSIIIWDLRLPKTLTCVLVGAILGLSGTYMQTILRNPLASPYTLGISSAASFGASIAITTGFPFIPRNFLNIPLSSMLFSLIACALMLLIGKQKGLDTKTMILFGVVLNFLFSALQSLTQYIADEKQVQQILNWLFGSVSKASWNGLGVTAIAFTIVVVATYPLSWTLNVMSVGEEQAKSLGVKTDSIRKKIFIASSLVTAVAVSYVGTIGFIGLVAPHFSKMLVGEDHRYLIPTTIITGSIILLLASIVSKLILPNGVLPIGIITNIVGVPFMYYLVLRGDR